MKASLQLPAEANNHQYTAAATAITCTLLNEHSLLHALSAHLHRRLLGTMERTHKHMQQQQQKRSVTVHTFRWFASRRKAVKHVRGEATQGRCEYITTCGSNSYNQTSPCSFATTTVSNKCEDLQTISESQTSCRYAHTTNQAQSQHLQISTDNRPPTVTKTCRLSHHVILPIPAIDGALCFSQANQITILELLEAPQLLYT
eukprot:jgi/Chrzof1/6373/Cz18g06060.t1